MAAMTARETSCHEECQLQLPTCCDAADPWVEVEELRIVSTCGVDCQNPHISTAMVAPKRRRVCRRSVAGEVEERDRQALKRFEFRIASKMPRRHGKTGPNIAGWPGQVTTR